MPCACRLKAPDRVGVLLAELEYPSRLTLEPGSRFAESFRVWENADSGQTLTKPFSDGPSTILHTDLDDWSLESPHKTYTIQL
jgi:hypothetical protein